MGPDAMILVFWMLSFKPITHVQLTFRPNITGELGICNYIQLNDENILYLWKCQLFMNTWKALVVKNKNCSYTLTIRRQVMTMIVFTE